MLFKNIINYVYPDVCGICGKRIFSTSYTCANCLSILKCYKERIIINSKFYDYMINLYEYKGIIKHRICKYKFREAKYISKTFAELASKKIKELNLKFDIIIPVPISLQRHLERGFNQSELIAKNIAKALNKEIYTNVLIKVRNNKKQSELKANERKNNVKGVYNIKNFYKIDGKTILLIDDIYTTGATINECSKTLKKYGAKKIIVLTIAYA